MSSEISADYVVVGAGSAGCAIAHRLAEKGHSVVLLEAGGLDWSPYIHVPAAIIKAIGNPRLDWAHMAQPDPSRHERVDLWPAGKVLGGSSSINGMLWVRGQARDYDGWNCPGWRFADVLPYFQRTERFLQGDPRLRGHSGPLNVDHLRSTHPLANTFISAAKEQGIPFNADYNGERQDGVAYSQVSQSRGWRYSASRAYLWKRRRPRSLKIVTRATARKLQFDGERCVGVEYRRRGQVLSALAHSEVIVSAGSLASPKLLMLSGIGPGEQLQSHDIPVRHHAPGVGSNLQEHPEGMVGIDVNVPTYNTEINSWKIPLHVLNWLIRGRGPATSPYPHAVAFIKSHESVEFPDIQIQLGPYAFDLTEDGVLPYHRPAISAAVNISYPQTSGQLRLRSSEPDAPPIIDHALLSNADDLSKLIAGCRQVRQIFEASAFDATRIEERLPGPDVQSDEEWEEYLRRTAFLGYHPAGTCRMGTDADAVVDPSLKVLGVSGLRVADASIMPALISGNTNATAVMIGERAADLVLAAT